MLNLHIVRTMIKYIPRKKLNVKYSRDLVKYTRCGNNNDLIKYRPVKDRVALVACVLPGQYCIDHERIESCLSISFGNIQTVINFMDGYSSFFMEIYFIKTNFKKTGFDSLKMRKRIFSEKYKIIKKIIDSPNLNIRDVGNDHLPNYFTQISKLQQTIYYRFCIKIHRFMYKIKP